MKDDNGKYVIYFFIAILVLGFTGWYYARPITIKLPKEELLHLPDAIGYAVKVTQFDAKGMPSNSFFTPKLTHYPNASSQFTFPRIILYSEKGEPWLIQADAGKSEKNTEIVTLFDHVILHQDASGKEQSKTSKTMTTSEITYYTKDDLATTSKMIFYQQPGLFIKSLGMTAHLKTEQIHLSQQVWSEYQQNATN